MLKDSRSTDDLRRSVADVYAVELDYLVAKTGFAALGPRWIR